MDDDRKRLARVFAERVADRLFTAGNGAVADRLVLFEEDVCGDKKRDLGGLCREAVVSQIVAVLEGRD